MSEYIRTNKFDTNECPNIFVNEKLLWTNVWIYIHDQYIQIFEYIRHTLVRMRIEISGQIEIRNLEMMSRVKEGLIKTGCGRRERENELMRIMVSMAHIPPSLVTWCHSTWQGVGWHNNICLFLLADFQREACHREEARGREGTGRWRETGKQGKQGVRIEPRNRGGGSKRGEV